MRRVNRQSVHFIHPTGETHPPSTVLFLDCKHHILGYEDVFYGTIDGASIHPRIVVQKALGYNAAAVIVAHNHPSGAPRKRTCVMQQMLPE